MTVSAKVDLWVSGQTLPLTSVEASWSNLQQLAGNQMATAGEIKGGWDRERRLLVGRPCAPLLPWLPLLGVLDADLAHGGEKAPSPYWASKKAILNFPSL